MRDILFRGKRLDNGEWVYGFYCHVPRGRLDLDEHLIQTVKKSGKMGMLHCVDPSTVGQYTGLKGKNGKKIFEGDVIRWNDWKGENQEGAVVWDPEWGRFSVFLDGAQSVGVNSHLGTDVEVVGNIHDNPELPEGEAEEYHKMFLSLLQEKQEQERKERITVAKLREFASLTPPVCEWDKDNQGPVYCKPYEPWQAMAMDAADIIERYGKEQNRGNGEHTSPCDLCAYNPPSSFDEKPCAMCPATSLPEEGEEE